ncbi:hypothetical protein HU200_064136 [Digitaria exilis]|uniref:Uncharacterized protein n=1 Tax=Digitaria exilis TaxID=1010633 RepID=A0A835A407_9POAL|nr:hypothetical protein HU200_064136 [Digitaria exilis]
MTPEEFRNPPDISVSSYAAVGPYILMSLEQRDKGTYGFHVVKKTWEKVGDNGLPFVGHGVPLGGSLFAACGVNGDRAVSVFHMSIKASSTPAASPEIATSVLSIQELPLAFPLASKGEIPQPDFFPLGKGSFCSIRKAACQSQESNCLVDLQIIKLTAFQMDNVEEANLAAEAPVQLGQHNHRAYEFNVRARSSCLSLPMPEAVVAVLSMDNEVLSSRRPYRWDTGGTSSGSSTEEDGRNRSVVYLALLRQDWTARQTSSPLYKVDVDITDDDPDSDDSSSPVAPSPAAAPRVKLHRTCDLEADMSGKTFVFLQSSGWIVGVGGDPGRTIILDTKTGEVIRGPDLVSKKWSPVVSVVGDKVYALTKAPNYLEDPDFAPWFEVLDLSNPIFTETTEEGFLQLNNACSWKALPYPIFFPHLLAPWEFRRPPVIAVLSSVVVGTYILVSLNQPSNCVFVFDTGSGQWHKVVGEHLPFVVAAAPRDGHGGDDIFLAFSRENGPIKAYRIVVVCDASTASKPSPDDDDNGGCAVELTITAIMVRNKEHLEVVGRMCLVSLDREHFSVLSWEEGHGRFLIYDKETETKYPRKLYLKLLTYRMESPVLHGKTPEIVVSSQREQTFKICSSLGFASSPIAFALSII